MQLDNRYTPGIYFILSRTFAAERSMNGVLLLSAHIHEIAHLWHQVKRQMHHLFHTTVRTHDLPYMAYPMLRQIHKEPGITISELSRRLCMAKSHVSNLTDLLARENFVEKRSDPKDQRLLRLYITPTALEGLNEMRQRSNQLWYALIEELPEGGAEELLHFFVHFTLHW